MQKSEEIGKKLNKRKKKVKVNRYTDNRLHYVKYKVADYVHY